MSFEAYLTNIEKQTGVTPDEFIVEMKAAPFPFQIFHPMCGGIPPELAWQSLRLYEHEVLPAFAAG